MLQAIIIEDYGMCKECLSFISGMVSEGYKIFKNQENKVNDQLYNLNCHRLNIIEDRMVCGHTRIIKSRL
jgi:hypothetical protein